MVRETRHLWVGNLPETVREDRIRDHFKRSTEDISTPNFEQRGSSYYERSSRLVNETTDQYIRRPNNYHTTNDLRGRTRDRIYRNGPYSSLIERTTPVGHHRVPSWYDSSPSASSSVSGGPGQSPASRSVYGNVASAVVQPDTGSSSSYDCQLIKKKKSRSGSESPCGGTSSSINAISSHSSGSHLIDRGNGDSAASSRSHSRSPSSCSSTNSTSSNSHASSPVSGSDQPLSSTSTRTRNLQSAVSAPSQSSISFSINNNNNNSNNNNNNNNQSSLSSTATGSGNSGGGGGGSSSSSSSSTGGGGGNGNPVVHSEDNRPLAICVRNLPARSSDTSLKDGLFHEYKKHGKVTWVKVVGQNAERYALVCFKKPDDVEKALEVSHDKLFFGCKIEVAPYQGYDVEDNEFRPYEAELDEYHPKSTRTLFIGNLEKDITSSELRKHFDCFGEIIEIDIKKQGTNAYAFCQYSDIVSVVKAMRKMDGEHLGSNRIKLGFGKSMPTNCVWIDGIADSVSENYLSSQFSRYGPVSQVVIDRERKLALVFFDQIQYAQAAVKEMRGAPLRGKKLQVDFASRECQEAFYDKLDKQTSGSSCNCSGNITIETTTSNIVSCVAGGRFSRYESSQSRPRTSSFSRHSGGAASCGGTSPNNVGSSSSGGTANATGNVIGSGSTPRGGGRSRSLRHTSDYEYSRFRNYDEYSQGSGASHDDDLYNYSGSSSRDQRSDSPQSRLGPIAGNSNVDTLDVSNNNGRRRCDKSPGDIRNLQKERSHLLEQLEECPSSGDEIVSPKKRMKFDHSSHHHNHHHTISNLQPHTQTQLQQQTHSADCSTINSCISSSSLQSQNPVISDSNCDVLSNHSNEPSSTIHHRKCVEVRRLSECNNLKYATTTIPQLPLSSSTSCNRRPSIESSVMIGGSGGSGGNPTLSSSSSSTATSRQPQTGIHDHNNTGSINTGYATPHSVSCKRRRTSTVSGGASLLSSGNVTSGIGSEATEYHSSRGRGHQLHSHHSHEASGGESADGSRPGTPLCDERPEVLPSEPRRIPRERPHEPMLLPLPKFGIPFFQQHRTSMSGNNTSMLSSHSGQLYPSINSSSSSINIAINNNNNSNNGSSNNDSNNNNSCNINTNNNDNNNTNNNNSNNDNNNSNNNINNNNNNNNNNSSNNNNNSNKNNNNKNNKNNNNKNNNIITSSSSTLLNSSSTSSSNSSNGYSSLSNTLSSPPLLTGARLSTSSFHHPMQPGAGCSSSPSSSVTSSTQHLHGLTALHPTHYPQLSTAHHHHHHHHHHSLPPLLSSQTQYHQEMLLTTGDSNVGCVEQPPASPLRARSLSSNSSDSDTTPVSTSPSIEERIKKVEEMYEKWSGSNVVGRNHQMSDSLHHHHHHHQQHQPQHHQQQHHNTTSSYSARHKFLELDVNEVKPSEIVKSVLAKKSIFDDDLQRLKNISDKYEPGDFSHLSRSSLISSSSPGIPNLAATKTAVVGSSSINKQQTGVFPSPVNQLQRLNSSPMNSPQAISPYNSPSPSPVVTTVPTKGTTTQQTVVTPQPAKGLQYPFPSHPPVTSTANSITSSSSGTTTSVTSSTALIPNAMSPSSQSIPPPVISLIQTQHKSTSDLFAGTKQKIGTIMKSYSVPEKTTLSPLSSSSSSSSTTPTTPITSNISGSASGSQTTSCFSSTVTTQSSSSTRPFIKSISVPGSTNVGTIKSNTTVTSNTTLPINHNNTRNEDETEMMMKSSRQQDIRRGSGDLSSSKSSVHQKGVNLLSRKNDKVHKHNHRNDSDSRKNREKIRNENVDKEKGITFEEKLTELGDKEPNRLEEEKVKKEQEDKENAEKERQERLARERLEREKLEKERQRQEKERIEREKKEREKRREKEEKEREEREKREKEERERRDKEERERKQMELQLQLECERKEHEEKERKEREEREEREIREREEHERRIREENERKERLEKERKEQEERDRKNQEERERTEQQELRDKEERDRRNRGAIGESYCVGIESSKKEKEETNRELHENRGDKLRSRLEDDDDATDKDEHYMVISRSNKHDKKEKREEEFSHFRSSQRDNKNSKDNSNETLMLTESSDHFQKHDRKLSITSPTRLSSGKRRLSSQESVENEESTKRSRLSGDNRKVIDRRDSKETSNRSSKHHKTHNRVGSLCKSNTEDKLSMNVSEDRYQKDSSFDEPIVKKKEHKKHDRNTDKNLSLSSLSQKHKRHSVKEEVNHEKDEEMSCTSEKNIFDSHDMRSTDDEDQRIQEQHQQIYQQQKHKTRKEHKEKKRNYENEDDNNGVNGGGSHRRKHDNNRQTERNKNNSRLNDDQPQSKNPLSGDKNRNKPPPHRKLTQSSNDSDSDEPINKQKHSIFDILDDGPYISMYDKVKARSCKNMQKQEEEKKIKAKFTQLKQSRAKREEKKRSTSYDGDSDSDFDDGHQSHHSATKYKSATMKTNRNSGFISSSDEAAINVQQTRRDHVISDSDSDGRRKQYNRAVRLNELCDDDSSESGAPLRRNAKKISSKRNSRSTRIASDSSDNEVDIKEGTNIRSTSKLIGNSFHEQKQLHQNVQNRSSPVNVKIKTEIKSEEESGDIETTSKRIEIHQNLSSVIKSEKMIKTEISKLSMPLTKVEPKNEIKEQSGGDCYSTQNEISESENNYFSGNTIENKDNTFDKLFSPETRKKHKKSKKRQKSSPGLLMSVEKDGIACIKYEDNTHIDKPSPTSLEHVFDELKRESMLAAAATTQSVNSAASITSVGSSTHSTSEKKKHKDRKEKKREKSRDDEKSMLTKEERHKLKKAKKSKQSNDNTSRYSFTSTTSVSSKRSGEKMEDIFGPISDEESQLSVNDSTIQHREVLDIPSNVTTATATTLSHSQQPAVSAAINPYKQEPLTPKSHTVEENEENKQKSSSHVERERHRKEKREKKRKERERNREQHVVTMFQQKTEDDNSVDLDEAGRALEAQLMDDSDNKLNEETTPSTATTHKSDMPDVFRFSDGDENSMEIVTTNQEKKDNIQEVHKTKEKKKKKKRSKEERHQRREHHHHGSSHNSSLMSPPSSISSSGKLSIEIAPDVVDEVVKEAICKPSPSLPCLLDDDTTSTPQITTPIKQQQQLNSELNVCVSPIAAVRDKNILSPTSKTTPSTTPKQLECKKKPDKFIPGFDVELDEKISESAVQSISAEFISPVIDPVPEEPKIPIESPPDLSKNIDKMEEKSRVIISQEETEDAVAALLGESFGTSSAPDYSLVDDSLDVQPEEESTEVVTETPIIPEEEGEEIRKAVQSLSNEDIDIKPDTPQSENDLQIDTDTEEPEDDTSNPMHFDNPPKTPDVDLSQIKQMSSSAAITTIATTQEITEGKNIEDESLSSTRIKVDIPQLLDEPTFDGGSKKIENTNRRESKEIQLKEEEKTETTTTTAANKISSAVSFTTQIPSSQMSNSGVTQSMNVARPQQQATYNTPSSIQMTTAHQPQIFQSTSQNSSNQQQQKTPSCINRNQGMQYVMQPPTISIPEQQHFVYSPVNVMVSPRQTGGERMQSPRLSSQQQSQNQQQTVSQQPSNGTFVNVRAPSPHSPSIHSRGQQSIRHQSQLSPVMQQHVVIQQRQQVLPSPASGAVTQQNPGVISNSSGSTNIILNRMPVTSVLAPISKPIQPTNIILPQPSTAQTSNTVKIEDTKEIKLASGQTITYQTARVSTPTSSTPISSVNTSPNQQQTSTIQIANQKIVHQSPQGMQSSPVKSVIETHISHGQTTHVQHIIPASIQQQKVQQHAVVLQQQQQQQQQQQSKQHIQQTVQQQQSQRLQHQQVQSGMQKLTPQQQQMMQQHQFIQQQQRQHQIQLQQQIQHQQHQQKHMQQQQQHHAQMMHMIQQQKQQQQQPQSQQHLAPQHRVVQQHVLQMHQYQQQQSQIGQKDSAHRVTGSSPSIIQSLPVKDVQGSTGSHSSRLHQNVVIVRQQTGVIPQSNLQKISQTPSAHSVPQQSIGQIHQQSHQQQQQPQQQQSHIQQQYTQLQPQRQYTQMPQIQQHQSHQQQSQSQHGVLQQQQSHIQLQQMPSQQRQLHLQKPQQIMQLQQSQIQLPPQQQQQPIQSQSPKPPTVVQPLPTKTQSPRSGDMTTSSIKALKVQVVAQSSQLQSNQIQSQVQQESHSQNIQLTAVSEQSSQQPQPSPSVSESQQQTSLIQTQQNVEKSVTEEEHCEQSSTSVEQITIKKTPVSIEIDSKSEHENIKSEIEKENINIDPVKRIEETNDNQIEQVKGNTKELSEPEGENRVESAEKSSDENEKISEMKTCSVVSEENVEQRATEVSTKVEEQETLQSNSSDFPPVEDNKITPSDKNSAQDQENITTLSTLKDDNELEQDSKEDSDYWSAKELNIDSVIKKVDALCSNDEVDESQNIINKEEENVVKEDIEDSLKTENESEFEKEILNPRKISESEQSEQKSDSSQLECVVEGEKSEKSEDTHDDEEEQEENQTDTTDSIKLTRGSGKRGRPSKNSNKKLNEKAALTSGGIPVQNLDGVQTRRSGKNIQGTKNRRGRPVTKIHSGSVPTAAEKKAKNQILDQDVYEFHEDSGEETSAVANSAAGNAKTTDRPRLILTIKSPGQASTTVVTTTKAVNEKSSISGSPSPSSPVSSNVSQTSVSSEKSDKDKEIKEEFSAPAVNTRKSRRLLEKDGRNTVDDVIEDVVRNSLNSPKSGGGQTPPRRSTRNSQNTNLGRALTPQMLEKTSSLSPDIRKSPRANRRTKDRKSSDASVDSSDEKSTKSEEKIKSSPQSEQEEISVKTVEEIVDETNKSTLSVSDKVQNVEESLNNRTTERVGKMTTNESTEPMALIDPVTGVLTVVRQSKEGQYVPVAGTNNANAVSTSGLTVVTKLDQTYAKVQTAPTNIKSESNNTEEDCKPSEVKSLVVEPEIEVTKVITPTSSTSPITVSKPTSVVVSSSQVTTPPQCSTPTSTVVQSHQSVTIRTPPPQQPQLQQIQPQQAPTQIQSQSQAQSQAQSQSQTQSQSQLQPQPQLQQPQPQPVPQPPPQTPQPQVQSQPQTQPQSQPQVQTQIQTQTVSQPTIRTHPLKAHMLNAQIKDTKPVVVTQPSVVKTNTSIISQTAPVVVNPNVVKQPSAIVQTNIVSRHLQQSTTSSPQILVPAQEQLQPQHSNLMLNIPPSNSPHAATPPLNASHSPRIQQPIVVKQQSAPPPQSQQTSSSQPVVHVVTKSGSQQHIPIQQTQHQPVVIQSQKLPQGQNPFNPVTIQTAVTIQNTGKHQTIQVPLPHIQSQQSHSHVQKQQSSGISVVTHPVVKQGSTPPIQAHLNSQHHLTHQQAGAHLGVTSTATIVKQQQQQQIGAIAQQVTGVTPSSQHMITHAHHQSSHTHQTTGASLLQAKPAHQQMIPSGTKGVIGLHQSPQIMTGAVASPPLKQSHVSNQQPIVTGASSLRASVPPISPQGQATSRAHILQPGLPVPAFEANLHDIGNYSNTRSQSPPPAHQQASPVTPGEGTFSTSAAVRGISRDHFIMYQQYLRAQEALGARIPYIPRSSLIPGTTDQKDISDIDESIAASPPLELRRPGSGPRTIAVPHNLQSPQDRATDSPQVAQVYVHGTRIPHPHYPEVGPRYFDNIRQVPTEPPPAHRPTHSVIAPSASNYGSQSTAIASTGGPPASLTQHMHPKVIEREHERERERERDKERQSLPGHTSMPSHGSLVPAMPTPTGRNIQVATPPHASQVPPQADSLLMLLQRYPVMWQGLLALKTDQAAVQMHFVFGNPHVARGSLPCNSDGSTPPLRIAQRMRLEQTQLEGVAKKMQYENEHCMLLALPCGRDHMDVLQQSRNLQTGFITYLQQKMAAGIVNIPVPGSEQAAYVVHIFPSCDFANENLERAAPDLKHRVAEIAHLLIVIATV